jgi:uncharacterized protein YbjT (DUF2867 family)
LAIFRQFTASAISGPVTAKSFILKLLKTIVRFGCEMAVPLLCHDDMRLLITGATGVLGRELARAASGAGHSVVALSHRVSSPKFRDAGRVLGDLSTGEGLQTAMKGVDAVIHAATDRRNPATVDSAGTERLVAVARNQGVRHFVHVSIAGVDDIPLAYYRAKRAAEQAVMASGLPFSILRATQFHQSLDRHLRALAAMPIVLALPKGFVVQPVDVREVAVRLIRCLDYRPTGRLVDFGGPHVLTVAEAAAIWMRINRIRKPIVNVPVPGAIGAAFRDQENTVPFGARARISWREWLLGRDTLSPLDRVATTQGGSSGSRLQAGVRRVS